MKKIQYLEARLSALGVGERSWFWFSPDSPKLPLLMERFADPKGMERLLKRAGSLPLPEGAKICTGISTVSATGELQFGSPMFAEGMLEGLATWVRNNIDSHPSLSQLCGAQFVYIDSNGNIRRRFQNPMIWEGLPRPSHTGTLSASEATLNALNVGEDAWIWMAEGKEEALAIAVPIKKDPKAEQFSSLVMAGRLRSGTQDAGIRGTVRRLTSGGLLLTTTIELHNVGARISSWLETF